MAPHADANWWNFEIDAGIRNDIERARITGQFDVNPLDDGRRLLEYHNYIGLDKLLECQIPSSRIPDERVFSIIHQLFELVFKLMIFDLCVIARTFEALLHGDDQERFETLCLSAGPNNEDFWRPALTASERIRFTSETMLRQLMRYLGKAENETFSSIEFYHFRDNLIPASGFQTAQFRLIQSAFGKKGLLGVRLFPSDTFRRNYGIQRDDPVRVTDSIILRNGTGIASPTVNEPSARVASLDDFAHNVLTRLPAHSLKPTPIERINLKAVDHACELLETLLEHKREENLRLRVPDFVLNEAVQRDNGAATVFREDLTQAVETENSRRENLRRARMGAFYLRDTAPQAHLTQVLGRLVVSDASLFGFPNPNSFLSIHYDVAKARINGAKEYARSIGKPDPPGGTGGGGIEYLGYSRRALIPFFPALVAYRGA